MTKDKEGGGVIKMRGSCKSIRMKVNIGKQGRIYGEG